jgi:hypothetical protein
MIAARGLLILLALLGFGWAGQARAADAEGSWAILAEGRVLAVLDLHRDSSAPGGWTGAFTAPTHMTMNQTHVAFDVSGPPLSRRVLAAAEREEALEFTIASPREGSSPDLFLFRQTAPDFAEFGWKDVGFPPMAVMRVPAGTKISTPWDPARRHPLTTPRPSNPDMKALFDADQADRVAGPKIDWKAVGPRDEARRARTLELVRSGALRSGDDFWHAAFILQHGHGPGDYLLAHSFAVIAAARGRSDAAWIAAATLDRYLQAIGQKQVYGTQFKLKPTEPATQEPYDRELVSEALREALGVPALAEQEKQRAEYDAEARERADPPKP